VGRKLQRRRSEKDNFCCRLWYYVEEKGKKVASIRIRFESLFVLEMSWILLEVGQPLLISACMKDIRIVETSRRPMFAINKIILPKQERKTKNRMLVLPGHKYIRISSHPTKLQIPVPNNNHSSSKRTHGLLLSLLSFFVPDIPSKLFPCPFLFSTTNKVYAKATTPATTP